MCQRGYRIDLRRRSRLRWWRSRTTAKPGGCNRIGTWKKIRVQHREYRNVFWTYRADGTWIRARYAEGLHKAVPVDRFQLMELVSLG
jgi:hypothetical protein